MIIDLFFVMIIDMFIVYIVIHTYLLQHSEQQYDTKPNN